MYVFLLMNTSLRAANNNFTFFNNFFFQQFLFFNNFNNFNLLDNNLLSLCYKCVCRKVIPAIKIFVLLVEK